MVSVLDLMILCLDVDSVEDLPNFGSAEESPADSSIHVLFGIVRNLAPGSGLSPRTGLGPENKSKKYENRRNLTLIPPCSIIL